MASTIKLKNGSGAPTSGQLVQGEPAFDLTNKRLYTENASGTVIEVGTNPSSLTTSSADINGGTIDGTVIGGSSAAAGTFTSITGTSANVNGTVTADGLTVDGDATISGAARNLLFVETDQVDKNTRIRQNGGNLTVATLADDLSTATNRILISHSTGDISFYEDTGTTAKFYWDASTERLGIGTTSPAAKLEIGGAGEGIILASPDGTRYKITVANGGILIVTAV